MGSLTTRKKLTTTNSTLTWRSISLIRKLPGQTTPAPVTIATGTAPGPMDLASRESGKLTDQD
jgi:hypothetical protein